MSNQFKVGDTVNLNSGGPAMTIEEINGVRVFTQWFDDKGEMRTGSFPANSLEEIDLGSPGV